MLAVGADEFCLDIYSLDYCVSFLSSSILEMVDIE